MFTPKELQLLLGLVRKQNPSVGEMTSDEVTVELKLSDLVKTVVSEPHNLHADFGSGEGLNAATDAEARDSIK